MEFQMIRIAEDVLDGSAVDHGDEPGAFSEPFSELGVIQVFRRFRHRRYGVLLRHCTVAEAFDLRKDVPHPVALLAAGAKFCLYLGVDGALSIDESLQTGGILSWLHAFQVSKVTGGGQKISMRVQAAE